MAYKTAIVKTIGSYVTDPFVLMGGLLAGGGKGALNYAEEVSNSIGAIFSNVAIVVGAVILIIRLLIVLREYRNGGVDAKQDSEISELKKKSKN